MALTLNVLDVQGTTRQCVLVGTNCKILTLERTQKNYMLKELRGVLFGYEGKSVKSARWLKETGPKSGFSLGLCEEKDEEKFGQWMMAWKQHDEARLEKIGDLIKREQESRGTSQVNIPDVWISKKFGLILSVSRVAANDYIRMANDFFLAGKKDAGEYFLRVVASDAWKVWGEGSGSDENLLEVPFKRKFGAKAFRDHAETVPDPEVYGGIAKNYYNAGRLETMGVLAKLRNQALK
jgi:hypothetical protein